MTKNWSDVRRTTPEKLERSHQRALEIVARMKLPEIRKARALSQQEIADAMNMHQGDVSKLEHRTDVYVSTLRRFIQAMGGQMRIVIEFPDSDPVELEAFGDLEGPPAKRALASI